VLFLIIIVWKGIVSRANRAADRLGSGGMSEYITSRKNSHAAHMRKLGTDASYRRECGEFLCEGRKLYEEANARGAEITAVLTCDESAESRMQNAPVYRAAREIVEYVSTQKTPQDIVFTCRIPDAEYREEVGGMVIVLESVQDPGNVGTVIRTANAFGVKAVLLTGNCADLYNPKTVRATMGAVFSQPVYEIGTEDIEKMRASGRRIYAAALKEDCEDVRNAVLEDAAVVIGSEGSGISEELFGLCTDSLIIPMTGGCESLNAAVAASVCMWEAFRGKAGR